MTRLTKEEAQKRLKELQTEKAKLKKEKNKKRKKASYPHKNYARYRDYDAMPKNEIEASCDNHTPQSWLEIMKEKLEQGGFE